MQDQRMARPTSVCLGGLFELFTEFQDVGEMLRYGTFQEMQQIQAIRRLGINQLKAEIQ
jgi:hypothetical protein